MGVVEKIIKLGKKEPKTPRTIRRKVKCKCCGTVFIGSAYKDGSTPTWDCPSCNTTVTSSGYEYDDYDDYDGGD